MIVSIRHSLVHQLVVIPLFDSSSLHFHNWLKNGYFGSYRVVQLSYCNVGHHDFLLGAWNICINICIKLSTQIACAFSSIWLPLDVGIVKTSLLCTFHQLWTMGIKMLHHWLQLYSWMVFPLLQVKILKNCIWECVTYRYNLPQCAILFQWVSILLLLGKNNLDCLFCDHFLFPQKE